MDTLLVLSTPHATAAAPLAQQWQVALQRQRPESERERLTAQLLELASWPNLTELPPELSRRLARICALLWRKRTAGLLVARVLDLPEDETLTLLAALRHFGHVRAVGSVPSDAETVAPAAELLPSRPRCGNTLAGKFWRHLTGCC